MPKHMIYVCIQNQFANMENGEHERVFGVENMYNSSFWKTSQYKRHLFKKPK